MTLLESVYKKSTKKRRQKLSCVGSGQNLIANDNGRHNSKRKNPILWGLQPHGGKAQMRPPVGMEVVLPSSAE